MTHREIAGLLGISPAALSLILNHRPGVSDRTRQRVLNELEKMGLQELIHPEGAESGIRKCISFVIYKKNGQILDLHPFFLLLMESIEMRASEYGCSVLLNMVDCRNSLEPQLKHLQELNPVGAIVFATEISEKEMEPVLRLPFPVVALDNDLSAVSCNTVSINNEMGTLQVIKYLAERGFKRIGYLKGQFRISSFEERERGFRHGAQLYGLEMRDEDIYSVKYTEDGSYRDLMELLPEREKLPEVFVCDDDTIAIGAIRALEAYGLKIPEDISVVGFNDRPGCILTDPQLTTVNVSRQGLAREAVDELMRMTERCKSGENGERSRKIRIGTSLVIRNSVK